MEFVIVQYPESRDVYIDEQLAGKTNESLLVEEGHHQFDLGIPGDYLPLSQEFVVEGTTELTPLVVIFNLAGDPV